MKSLFFAPIYNQARELPRLLEELKDPSLPCSKILLVDDGSNDGSEKLIESSGFEFIRVETNHGVGHSFMLAVDYALKHDFDVIGVIAGNGKMLPSEMPRVLLPILNDEKDFVWGSRFREGGASPNLPLFRRLAIPICSVFVRILTGTAITDATCGYRAFRLSIFKSARFDWHAKWLETYGFETYLHAKVVMAKRWRFLEVPVTMKYPESGVSYSKMKPIVGWYQMMLPWVVARVDRKWFS